MSVIEIIFREILIVLVLSTAVHCVIAAALLVVWIVKRIWRKIRRVQ